MGDLATLIVDFVIVLGAAVVMGIVCERVGIGSVIGYLLAGVLVGPSVLGLVATSEAIAAISSVGVALLLFTIGLEFSWKQLVRFGARGIVAGAVAICSMILIVTCAGIGLGLDWKAAFVLGSAASLGSTAIVLRILRDRNDLDSLHGRFAVAVLLTQDIAVVPLLLAVSFVSAPSGNFALTVGTAVIKTILLVVALAIGVSFVLPRLLDERTIARNREIPILIAITVGVGSIWAATALGVSPALGAFIAGLMLAESRFADQMRADVFPLKTLFLTVFFVSVGLFADVVWMAQNAGMLLVATVGLLAVKAVVTYLSIRKFQLSIIESVATSLAIAQIGEFSFVVLSLGREGQIMSEDLFRLAASVTLLTLLATPFLTGNARDIADRLARAFVPKRRLARAERAAQSETEHGHIVVIGYGAAGGAAAELLNDQGWPVTVLDIDPAYVTLAAERGLDALLGDGTQTVILERAHIAASKAVVVAVPDTRVARSIVSQCKHIAPEVLVFARSRYHIFSDELTVVGADTIVDEEQSVGVLLGEAVLARLGSAKDLPKDA